MLPCGMMVMLTMSLIKITLICLAIISKGFMNVVGEFIALVLGVSFTVFWISAYNATDRHVKENFDEEGNGI